jgi:hypothetical protein
MGPDSPTDSATSNTQGPELCPLYIAHRQKDALGRIRGTPQDAHTGVGYQEFMGAVDYKRSGLPDIGVYKPLRGPQHGVRVLGSSRTHAVALTAFEAALEGHGRSQQIRNGSTYDLPSQDPAKYRPHRPRRP